MYPLLFMKRQAIKFHNGGLEIIGRAVVYRLTCPIQQPVGDLDAILFTNID